MAFSALDLAARRRVPAGAVTWGTCFCSGRAFARTLAGVAFAASVFGLRALDGGVLTEVVLEDVVREEVVLEGAFTARVLDAPDGLGAAGLAGRPRRPVLMFRTRFIMAPVT